MHKYSHIVWVTTEKVQIAIPTPVQITIIIHHKNSFIICTLVQNAPRLWGENRGKRWFVYYAPVLHDEYHLALLRHFTSLALLHRSLNLLTYLFRDNVFYSDHSGVMPICYGELAHCLFMEKLVVLPAQSGFSVTRPSPSLAWLQSSMLPTARTAGPSTPKPPRPIV